MCRKAILLLFLLFFLLLTSSFTDDAVYYGDGVDVYPLQNTDIQLVSEIITITKGWDIHVDMTFKNHGHDTTVQMGFPLFSSYTPEDEEGVFDHKFQTWVNGKKVAVVKKHGVPHPVKDLGIFPENVYTYPVSFKKGETKKIVHSYTVGGYSNSIGWWKFKYILRTGALWKGPIENLKIFYKTSAEWARRQTCINPGEHASQLNGEELILKWEFKNYKPRTDLTISGINPLLSKWYSFSESETADNFIKNHKRSLALADPCNLRNLKNRIFASYGYPFKKPFIRSQFYYPGSPYKENPAFTMNRITDEDRLIIDYLTKIENWKLTLKKRRMQGVLDYETEVESLQSKFEEHFIYPLALNRNNNTMIEGGNEKHLLFLGYPNCIPQNNIRLSSLFTSKHKKVSGEISVSDSRPILSLDGRYFAISCSYWAGRFDEEKKVILIIDVVNASLIKMTPVSSYEAWNQIQFSKDSSMLFTVEAAYDVHTGKKIKDWYYPESINQETLKLIPGTTTAGKILFVTQMDNKIYSLNVNTGKFAVKEITVKGIDIKTGDFTMSWDGKYLAGTVFSVKEKQLWKGARRDKVGKRLMIWKITEGTYHLLYDEVIKNYPWDSGMVWIKERPYFFMVKFGKLWRYRLNPDDKVDAVKMPIESVQGQGKLKLNNFSIGVYGRLWDIETGKKFWPWYEALDPFDKTNQLPLYDANPLPVHLREYWGD